MKSDKYLKKLKDLNLFLICQKDLEIICLKNNKNNQKMKI